MKIDFDEIKELIANGNLADIVRETKIPRRTLENYKYKTNKSFEKMEETLTALQKYINQEENKMVYLITGFVKYKNGNEDIREFYFVEYPETLDEVLDDIDKDIFDVSGRSQGGVTSVEYMIYHAENGKLDDDQYMEELYANGTEYYVSYDNNSMLDEVNIAGLEYQGEEIKEFEDYKVFVNSFEEFVDDIVYDLENDHGIKEVPNYATLEEPALTLLKNGRIQDARERLEHEILEFNDMD